MNPPLSQQVAPSSSLWKGAETKAQERPVGAEGSRQAAGTGNQTGVRTRAALRVGEGVLHH